MKQSILNIELLIRDYDEAIAFFTKILHFTLIEDTPESNKRWVVIAPAGSYETRIVLARPKNAAEAAAVGNQTGGRVFLSLETDDFDRDYAEMKERKIEFIEEPREEPYAKVAKWKDPWGNIWDLMQMKK